MIKFMRTDMCTDFKQNRWSELLAWDTVVLMCVVGWACTGKRANDECGGWRRQVHEHVGGDRT